jgi:hypothetical protein
VKKVVKRKGIKYEELGTSDTIAKHGKKKADKLEAWRRSSKPMSI